MYVQRIFFKRDHTLYGFEKKFSFYFFTFIIFFKFFQDENFVDLWSTKFSSWKSWGFNTKKSRGRGILVFLPGGLRPPPRPYAGVCTPCNLVGGPFKFLKFVRSFKASVNWNPFKFFFYSYGHTLPIATRLRIFEIGVAALLSDLENPGRVPNGRVFKGKFFSSSASPKGPKLGASSEFWEKIIFHLRSMSSHWG